jgi:hypothetical protein
MSEAAPDAPAGRAERLLRDVLGEDQFTRLRTSGYLDLPSQRFRGRVYRLDVLGNLSYRDAGEAGFNTTLCVQPVDAVPRDDQVVMRYLLVTADEDRLLEVANPIAFGFVSLIRALYHDFSQRYAAVPSALLTFFVIAFFLGSVGMEAWTLGKLLHQHPVVAAIVFLVFLVPAFVGIVLVVAGVVEMARTLRAWQARTRMSAPRAV